MSEMYLEDLAPGQTFRSSESIRVEAARIKAFASEFDPQPFHLDDEGARRSLFGGLARAAGTRRQSP